LTPKWRAISTRPPKGTSLGENTSYDVGRQNRSNDATCGRNKKDTERNPTVANWIFAQTTHVVAATYDLRVWSYPGSSYIF